MKSNTPFGNEIALYLCLFLLGLQLACKASTVTVQPPSQSLTQLLPQYQLKFEQNHQDWLQTTYGNNIIAHGVISDPTILYEDGLYRMWFTAALHPYTDEQVLGTAYAESEDGLIWRPRIDSVTGEPLLVLHPTPGGWDASGVETPFVLKQPTGQYLLYYTGTLPPEGSNSWAIGLATSNDGITWNKVGDSPVMEGLGGWEGPFFDETAADWPKIGGVSEPSVLFNNYQNLYQMWYSALGYKESKLAFRMGYATSVDGIIWQHHPEPVLEPDVGGWDSAVVSHVNVVYEQGLGYHLFYFGTSEELYRYAEENGAAMIPGSIGHAFSFDGLGWKKDSNPVLSIVPETWEAWMIGGPSALIQDNQVKLWYFGSAEYDTFEFHIGFATARLP
jgi:predicted GH43/DUF377 family glycosyl hydrolase